MYYNYRNDENNWLLYLLMVVLAIIIISNIGVAIWQCKLEKQYDAKYEETEKVSEEYKETYYSIGEAMNSCANRLKEIHNEAVTITKQSLIALMAELLLTSLTCVPIYLMYQIFKRNKELSYFYLNDTTATILVIETLIAFLTCLWDIKGAMDTISQYSLLCNLVDGVYDSLGSIIDAINYQINQY